MKSKIVFATAATLLALATGGAQAQGSTEIYGRLNLSAERQDLDGTKNSGIFDNSSRIGFRGTEDLGGGLKAGFVLEHGFNADTGSIAGGNWVGAFWGRESTLSLSGSFGTLRFGNMPASEAYFATADYVSMHNHDTGSSADALYGFVSVGQLTSAIAYTSPTIEGLRFDVQYGLKEGNARPDSPLSVAAVYDAGPLHLGFGYEGFDGNKSTAVRALYEMGAITVGGYVEKGSGDTRYTNFRLAGMYTMGVSEFHLNFGKRGDTNDVDGTDADQFTLGYNYNLSKRSKLYGYYTKLSVGSADFSSYAVGMRHNF